MTDIDAEPTEPEAEAPEPAQTALALNVAPAGDGTVPLAKVRHERFAQNMASGMSGIDAYIAAGYEADEASARVCATRLLANVAVKLRIDALVAEDARKAGVTRERVIAEMAKIAFADLRKAVRWGEAIPVRDPETGELEILNGVALVGSDAIDNDTAAALSEVRQTRDGVVVKLHDKQTALTNLARHFGMFDKEQHHTHAHVQVNLTGDDLNLL